MEMKIWMEALRNKFAGEAQKSYGKKDAVRFLGMTPTQNGGYCLKWKTIDEVNYVHRASLSLSPNGRELLSVTCTCGQNMGCVHLAAAMLYGKQDAFAFETATCEEEIAAEEPTLEPEEPTLELEDPMIEIEDPMIEIEDPEIEDTETEAEEPMPDAEEDETQREPAFEWDGIAQKMQVLLGRDLGTEENVYWEPNDTEKVFHTNTGIIGTMGTGKTQFTKSLVTQLYREQLARKNFDGSAYNILIFDYKGDYNDTKPEFTQAVDAHVYKPYRLSYNPFSLVQTRSFRPLLPVHTANTFKDTLTKCFHLGHKQQQLLLDCIMEAYGRCGIMAEDPSTWNRRAPTFAQVYEVFAEKTENRPADSLSAAMNRLYQFRIFSSEAGTTIPITQFIRGVTVLDLSGYDPDIQSFVVAITLDQFYAHMMKEGSSKTDGHLRQLRTMILVDEADNFMKEDFTSLRKILKEGREFGVGMVLSTQSLDHFVGGDDDYSRYVLTWVVHNVSDLSQREVEYIFKLQPKSPEVTDLYCRIKALEKHESILKIANAEPVTIRDKAFYELMRE